MASFDVYLTPTGYVVDVQTDLIDGLGTRLVVPLLPPEVVPAPVRRLHPVFEIEGRRFLMATHLMSAIRATSLGRPVASLDHEYDRIRAALDMVFLGF